LETVRDLQAIFGMVLAGLSVLSIVFGFIFKFLVWPFIRNYIDKRTDQIQPDSNGGKSLPDIALMLGELKGQMGSLLYRIEIIEKNTASKRLKR
jgi:ABC-type phosphate transport system permease subunit